MRERYSIDVLDPELGWYSICTDWDPNYEDNNWDLEGAKKVMECLKRDGAKAVMYRVDMPSKAPSKFTLRVRRPGSDESFAIANHEGDGAWYKHEAEEEADSWERCGFLVEIEVAQPA